MSKRRKISKEERAERDRLMEYVKWATILCMRRMIEAGWTNSRIAGAYDQMNRDIGNLVVTHAMPDHHYVECNDIADMVFCAYESEKVLEANP